MIPKTALFIPIIVALFYVPAYAWHVVWDIEGVQDEGGWSSWDGKKIAITFYINGAEVGRVWDDPANRTADIQFSCPAYFTIGGRVLAYAPPYPATPGEMYTVPAVKYSRRLRTLDDNSTVDQKHNQAGGHYIPRYGETR